VPLVEAGHDRSPENRDGSPTHGPPGVVRGQGFAPGAEEQRAQNRVADHMTALANIKVPVFKSLPVHAEEKMQQWIKNSAGVMGREQSTGLNGNDNEPQNRGDPRLQYMMRVAVQARSLLDAIVGGLAGDHDVVHVTLAQSGAADAYEARFLQQFGDSGAAAVAHA